MYFSLPACWTSWYKESTAKVHIIHSWRIWLLRWPFSLFTVEWFSFYLYQLVDWVYYIIWDSFTWWAIFTLDGMGLQLKSDITTIALTNYLQSHVRNICFTRLSYNKIIIIKQHKTRKYLVPHFTVILLEFIVHATRFLLPTAQHGCHFKNGI